MGDPIDQHMMRQALSLAVCGRGRVEPNPMVGCIIARNGQILGQGYHQSFGGPHAERKALTGCRESPAGATAYVSLEPCCHVNKKTPPCVPALIDAELARVVVGCLDPNPAVSGSGIDQLRRAGVDVELASAQEMAAARQLNAPFFKSILHRRPYVTLKWAESADGKIAGPHGQPRKISSDRSHRLVHELRARCDAILVGIQTVLADDPMLTARSVDFARPLLRCVLDTRLRLPDGSQLLQTAKAFPLLVFCDDRSMCSNPAKAAALAEAGAQLIPTPLDHIGQLSLSHVLDELHRRTVTHLLVESGPTLARSFLLYADRLWVFRSPRAVADETAPAASPVPPSFNPVASLNVTGDILTEYLSSDSPVYFSPEPSADFRLSPAD